jgi:Condensation domain
MSADPFGLCWGQKWSWHEQQVPASRRNPGLVLRDVLDLPEGLDRDGIRAVLHLLLSRHTSLRTSFFRDLDGAPRQRTWPVSQEAYELEDFEDVPRCDAWLRQPLDILTGWPLRVAVLRPGDGPARLGIAVHHVAADMHGFRLLCEELREVAGAFARGAEPSLPPVGRQPVDIAEFERSPAGQALNERTIAYWLDQDESLGAVLDALRSRFDEPGDAMHVARVVSAGGRRRLADLAGATGSSEPTVAVAAVSCVLAGHLGRASFPMTMLVNNRHLRGLERSVASVAQSGLIRAGVPDPRDLASAIPEAWSGMLTAMQHARYDGDELSERMRSFDSGGLHVTAGPPSVNVVRTASPRDEAPETSWVGQVDQRCVSLYFHVRVSESHLAIELRAGTHLLTAAGSLALVTDAMNLMRR